VRMGSNPSTSTYTYDRNGNQLTRTTTGQPTETKTYDVWNQLISIIRPSMTATYIYRADGLRQCKTVNGVRTIHVWDVWGNIVLELNAQSVVTDRFIYSLSGRLIQSHLHGWYLMNVRGDVVQRVNDQGVVLRTYRYTAFGIELSQNSDNTNPFRFAGEFWDAETATYYLRARSFCPRRGRFTQPDPLFHVMHGNLQGSVANILQAGNLFVYCINNPVMWNDPTGLVIQLAGTEQQNNIILTYLQRLTDHRLTFCTIEGIVSIASRANEDSRLASGNALIERMIASEHITRIYLQTSDANHVIFNCETNMSTYGVGSGSSIHFNRSATPQIITLNSRGVATLTTSPAHMGLAHELIHADRAMRGVVIPLNQMDTISFEADRARFSPFRLFAGPTRTVRHQFRREEMATIGIRHFTDNCITENMIGREQGQPWRLSHNRRI